VAIVRNEHAQLVDPVPHLHGASRSEAPPILSRPIVRKAHPPVNGWARLGSDCVYRLIRDMSDWLRSGEVA
jgi:hypothetical protein